MTTRVKASAGTGVIVINYGSHVLLERHLGGIDHVELGLQIFVVDNFFSIGEREAVERLSAARGWCLVSQPDNKGFGAAVNTGLDIAAARGCDCFVILNPDVAISAEVLAELGAHCRRDPLALITPRLVTPSGVVAFAGSQVYLDTGRIKRLPPPEKTPLGGEVMNQRRLPDGRPARAWLPGTCLALHGDLLARVGGFDEPYFLYWEDVDLSVRCADAGGSLVIRHDLTVTHEEGGTQGRRNSRALSSRYYYWNCRNRLRFAAQHLPRRQLFQWIMRTPTESWQILLRGGRRQLVRSPACLVAAARGSFAGIAIAVAAMVRGPQFARRGHLR